MNAQREMLTNSPYPSTLEGDLQDVQQALKEINKNGKNSEKKMACIKLQEGEHFAMRL